MPMVAESPYGLVDATLPDDALPVPWRSVHRVRPRVRLLCRWCRRALHAKVSSRGLRFFAHDVEDKRCRLTGETLQHRLLKSALAGAVRLCGWHAILEARDADGRWIADVLATSPDGSRRIAWEAQLARQNDDDTLKRTDKYRLP